MINVLHTDQLNISKWLVENGADINHKGAYGETPLIIASDQGEQNKLNSQLILIENCYHKNKMHQKFCMKTCFIITN